MLHPNREAVLELIEYYLSKRHFRDWRLQGIHYDAQHSAYDLVCTNGTTTVQVRIVSEWVDEALGKGISSRRRFKDALRTAFKIEIPDSEND
jgi:hypothetical protein